MMAVPEAISRMPLPWLWSFLYFSMLFLLGVASQFGMAEVLITAVYDQYPPHPPVQLVLIVYIYGNRVSAVSFGPSGLYIQLAWKFLAPAATSIICLVILWTQIGSSLSYGKGARLYVFPQWAIGVGLGKVVIVTGSSSGIGQDAAVLFAQRGASIVIHGQSNERLQETENLLRNAGINEKRWLRIVGPIEDEGTQRKLIDETVAKFGRLDVLVNNAGLYRRSDLDPESMENLDYLTDVNLKSVIALTRAALPHLEKAGGNVVNISSIYGQRGTAALSNYALTKAAVEQWTRNAAIAYGKKGAYGVFVERTVPLGRMGRPREVSEMIGFLASERASYCTGGVYLVDGGSLAGQF
ncbi:3-oxoacyl-[acyl-carrier-protein] reductase FabG-like [Aphelenchoides fujianensis]|nr:3-oxoacyl-[acyl-carrier-protein] reductase FabG-like [Aphelenchoides fujianensis]